MLNFRKKPVCTPAADGSGNCALKVALVGNPNVGKSVLFNALTGAYVTVSNYPGTSVEVARGSVVIDGVSCEIIDTPGMYSILPITEEERVAREILLHESPDVVIHVLDARNLERMLAMTLQLIEAGLPVILVVNIMDEAERMGLVIDIPLLAEKLGIPVIAAAAAKKIGLPELREAIIGYDRGHHAVFGYSRRLEADLMEIMVLMAGKYTLAKKSLALLLLQRDEEVAGIVRDTEGEEYAAIEGRVREKMFARRDSFHLELSMERKMVVKGLIDGVFRAPDKRRPVFGERLSRLAIRPLTGVPLLLIILYFGLYKFVGSFGAGTVVDFLEGTLFEGYFNPWVISLVNKVIPWEILRELFVGEYGVITLGLRYAVGIILPIVATFFLFFSILEDSGYFPRLALLVDRLFKKIGLTGRAVIPMVLGFGCDTMATMVTRGGHPGAPLQVSGGAGRVERLHAAHLPPGRCPGVQGRAGRVPHVLHGTSPHAAPPALQRPDQDLLAHAVVPAGDPAALHPGLGAALDRQDHPLFPDPGRMDGTGHGLHRAAQGDGHRLHLRLFPARLRRGRTLRPPDQGHPRRPPADRCRRNPHPVHPLHRPVSHHAEGTGNKGCHGHRGVRQRPGVLHRVSSERVPGPDGNTLMKCGFCGFEFDEEEANTGCKSCPMSSGCRMIKCPRCNYENPPEPTLVRKIKKILKKSGS